MVLSKHSGYNRGFLENTLSRKGSNFINCRMVLHIGKLCFLMIFLIFPVTCFCIDFRCVLASLSIPFLHLFSIHFHVFGCQFFSCFSDDVFFRFSGISGPKMDPKSLHRCSGGVRPGPQMRASAPKAFQRRFFIDLASFLG